MNRNRILIGIGTPQANPTVEIEFQRFMRSTAQPLFARLTSPAVAANDRLTDYMRQIPDAVRSFDTLPIRLFAFACTGSSYLLGSETEEEICTEVLRQHRVAVVTATQAIRRELEGRGARRIALLAPYPQDLCDSAIAYWDRLGFDAVVAHRIDIGDDTRRIYDLDDEQVALALERVATTNADVVLLCGTGMPTIAALQSATRPILSSNLCLATEALRRVHLWPANEAADVARLLQDDN